MSQSLPVATAVSPRADVLRRRDSIWPIVIAALVIVDVGALGAAFALAYVIRFKIGIPFMETPPHRIVFYSSIVFWEIPVWLALFALYRLYDRHYLFVGFQEYTRIVNACTVGVLSLVGFSFLDRTLVFSRGWLLLTWFLAVLAAGVGRFGSRRALRFLRGRGRLTTPTVIVGANDEGRALAEQFLANPSFGTRVLGFVDGS